MAGRRGRLGCRGPDITPGALLLGQAATGDEAIVHESPSNDFVKRRLSVVEPVLADGDDPDAWENGGD